MGLWLAWLVMLGVVGCHGQSSPAVMGVAILELNGVGFTDVSGVVGALRRVRVFSNPVTELLKGVSLLSASGLGYMFLYNAGDVYQGTSTFNVFETQTANRLVMTRWTSSPSVSGTSAQTCFSVNTSNMAVFGLSGNYVGVLCVLTAGMDYAELSTVRPWPLLQVQTSRSNWMSGVLVGPELEMWFALELPSASVTATPSYLSSVSPSASPSVSPSNAGVG